MIDFGRSYRPAKSLQVEICERDVRATIRLIDVPHLGFAVSKRVGYAT